MKSVLAGDLTFSTHTLERPSGFFAVRDLDSFKFAIGKRFEAAAFCLDLLNKLHQMLINPSWSIVMVLQIAP